MILCEFTNPVIKSDNQKKYKIKDMEELKTLLDKSKSQLDELYKDKEFVSLWKNCNPFKYEKKIIAQLGNTYNVSNAWLKCYEILNHFNILPNQLTSDTYLHFDNAAFPGSFILSVHHLCHTRRSYGNKYKWVASSLIEPDATDDKYLLYKNYPNNWLMDAEFNGDVTKMDNILHFHDRLKNSVDLYTSDLGFNVASDYNNQELLHCRANIGQILSGLLTLKEGGCFITKQYTMFEAVTLSVIYATSTFFNEFYVCKPISSKSANSEIYLVGKGFKSCDILSNQYIKKLIQLLDGDLIPLFDVINYPKYVKKMINLSKGLIEVQIDKINQDIKKIKSDKFNKVLSNINDVLILEWYENNPILPILNEHRLNMFDVYKQCKR